METRIEAVKKTYYRKADGQEGRTYLVAYKATDRHPRRRLRVIGDGEKLPRTVVDFILCAGGIKKEVRNEVHPGGWLVYQVDTYTPMPERV